MAADVGAGGGARRFATTHWSLVIAAGDSAHPHYRDALGELCRLYWGPVRAFVRRRVSSDAQADDLTQGFFAALLDRDALAAADRDRGRFRGFLLASVRHYLADQWDRDRAQKRGGGETPLPLDASQGSQSAFDPPDTSSTPDREYDRQWALALLDLVRQRLDGELAERSDASRMRRLAGLLTDDETRYRDVADELGMTESAVKVSVHRLRKRYGAILREEVLRTVSTPEAVDEELRFLLMALSA